MSVYTSKSNENNINPSTKRRRRRKEYYEKNVIIRVFKFVQPTCSYYRKEKLSYLSKERKKKMDGGMKWKCKYNKIYINY